MPLQSKKKRKEIQIGKEIVKLSLFTDDTILYISLVQFSHSVTDFETP